MTDTKYLAIYLNDHFAGAIAGLELARRSLSSNRGSEFEGSLSSLVQEISEDRDALQDLMERLQVARDPIKPVLAWSAEKVGRLKLNGRLRGYSPLSRVVEFEGLSLGIEGKLRLWRNLDAIKNSRSALAVFPLGELIRRAEEQLAGLEKLRVRAAEIAFE